MGGRRGVAIGVTVALLGVGVTACSSGGGGGSKPTVLRTVRARITYGDPTRKGAVLAVDVGELDFTHLVGEYRMDVSPGKKPSDSVHTIVDGRRELIQLTPQASRQLPPRVVAGKHWETQPRVVSSNHPLGTNPYTELADLRAEGAHLVDRGLTRVDGHPARHYTTRLTRKEPLIPGHHLEHVSYDLYVDAHHRVVRLVSETTHDDTTPSPPERNQVDYSDFGVPVHITLPRSGDIVQYSSAIVPTPKLQSAWRGVASGRNAHFSWKLFRAAADVDRVCWSFEATPPLRATTSTVIGSLPGIAQMRRELGSVGPWPRHDGHAATCTRTGVWQTDLEPIVSGESGGTVLVAALGPDVVRVNAAPGLSFLQPTGQPTLSRSRPIPIDARFHGFVDLAAPGLASGGLALGENDYTLTRRNGSHVSCSTMFLAGDIFGIGPDPCLVSKLLAAPTKNTAMAVNITPPSF